MFKKVAPPKSPNNWNAHVTGMVNFENKNQRPQTYHQALTVEGYFNIALTKGEEKIVIENMYCHENLATCEYSWDIEKFYRESVTILENRRGEFDKAMKKVIAERIGWHFRKEREKSYQAKFDELIKQPLHIKMDITIKNDVVSK